MLELRNHSPQLQFQEVQVSTEAIDFLKSDRQIVQFAIIGELLAIRTKNIIIVYRDYERYVAFRKKGEIKKEVVWVWEDEVDDKRNPVAKFQPNEAGWNYALGFIRQFGGEGIQFSYIK